MLALPLLLLAPLVQEQDAAAFPGYTLFAPTGTKQTFLVDMQGEVVHTWHSELISNGAVELLPNGHLMRAAIEKNEAFSGGGQAGRIQELDWDGKVVWDFTFSSPRYHSHHDFEVLPYGNVLLIAWEHKTAEEALAAGRAPGGLGAGALWPDFLVEIEPLPPDGGQVVWEWHLWDHLVQDEYPARGNHGDVAATPGRLDLNVDLRAKQERDEDQRARLRALGYLGDDDEEEEDEPEPGGGRRRDADWNHSNSLDYDPATDRILLGSRNMSEVWVIDHGTTIEEAAGPKGDFLARLGNPQSSGRGSDYDQRFFFQHQAHWIPYGLPGAGNLLLFNNGPQHGERVSSVLEVRLPDSGRPEVVWELREIGGEPFFSSHISGAQRLPNGNTLVCIGGDGRLAEVTNEGEVVWEYLHPIPARAEREDEHEGHDHAQRPDSPEKPQRPQRRGLFKATRYSLDYPGVAKLGER